MRGTIGLLIYVAVMVLSGILKKMAQEKVKRASAPPIGDVEAYEVTLDDMTVTEPPLVESMEPSTELGGFAPASEESGGESGSRGPQDVVDWDTWEEYDDWDDTEDDLDASAVKRPAYGETGWAHAIVLSEIIREPRVKRPWPNR
ncbi:MAG TPA: hypothetical protein GXZ85_09365 [Firmicutes bacterium]|jgi:hypothetical protein|nr:hypothetical protein [Bacillota bacterium]